MMFFKSAKQIKAYRGFGNSRQGFVMGHFFHDKPTPRSKLSNKPWINTMEMIKRYQVKMAPDKALTISIGSTDYRVVSRDDGFFSLQFDTSGFDPGIYRYTVKSVADPSIYDKNILFIDTPDTLIVSDIDDTILLSHSTSTLKKLRLLLTKNPEKRKYLESTRMLYQKIKSGGAKCMMFYVSSSEWNLYDFIYRFFHYHRLSQGFFLLQDIKHGLRDLLFSGTGSHTHKKQKIEFLLSFFADSTLVLIGDSGQKDVDIYTEIGLKYPERIKKIFIRTVKASHEDRLTANFEKLSQTSIKVVSFS